MLTNRPVSRYSPCDMCDPLPVLQLRKCALGNAKRWSSASKKAIDSPDLDRRFTNPCNLSRLARRWWFNQASFLLDGYRGLVLNLHGRSLVPIGSSECNEGQTMDCTSYRWLRPFRCRLLPKQTAGANARRERTILPWQRLQARSTFLTFHLNAQASVESGFRYVPYHERSDSFRNGLPLPVHEREVRGMRWDVCTTLWPKGSRNSAIARPLPYTASRTEHSELLFHPKEVPGVNIRHVRRRWHRIRSHWHASARHGKWIVTIRWWPWLASETKSREGQRRQLPRSRRRQRQLCEDRWHQCKELHPASQELETEPNWAHAYVIRRWAAIQTNDDI